jgi:predicted RNA methylase
MAQDKKSPLYTLYESLKADNYDVPDTYESFERTLTASGKEGTNNRVTLYNSLRENNYDVPDTYESFANTLFVPVERSEEQALPTTGAKSSGVAESLGDAVKVATAEPVEPMYTPGMKAALTESRRMVERMTPEGRKRQRDIEMSARMAGVETTLPGITKMPEPKVEADDKGASTNTAGGVHAPMLSPEVAGFTFDENGNAKAKWQLGAGRVTSDILEADAAEYRARESRLALQRQRADMTVGAQLQRALEERKRLDEQMKRRKAEIDARKAGHPASFISDLANNSHSAPGGMTDSYGLADYSMDEQYRQLESASRKNNETIQTLSDKMGGQMDSFWHSLGAKMADGYTLTDGLASMNDAISLMDAKKRLDEINRKRGQGESLTQEEEAAEAVLKATIINDDAQARYGSEYGAWARAGMMLPGTLDMMKDIMLTPGAGTIAKGIASGVSKGLGRAISKVAGDKVAENIAARFITKATGIMIGAHAVGAMQVNTTGISKTMGEAGLEFAGDVEYDDNGNYIITGQNSAIGAMLAAERNQIREYGSEMFGEFIPGLGGVLLKGIEKIGLKKLSGQIKNIGTKTWYNQYSQLLKRGGFNGLPGEGIEEYEGYLFDALTGHMSDAVTELSDLNTHIDIWLGCATTGAILGGVPMAAGSMHTAQYYCYRHKAKKSDTVASETLGADRWAEIRDRLDYTPNEGLSDALTDIIGTAQDMTAPQKVAVMDYVRNLVKMRGYNIAQIDAAEDDGGEPPSSESINDSFRNGYTASTPQEMADVQNMYELQRKRAVDMMGEENLTKWVDEADPVQIYGDTATSIWSDEERDVIRDYINAKIVRAGMIQRVNDDIDEKIAQSNAMVDLHTNNATGVIQPAVMGLDDRQVYIVSGNIVTTDTGAVDLNASDDSIVVCDAKTGRLEFSYPKAIKAVGEAINPEEEKSQAAETIRQQFAQAAVDKMNGALAFNPGEVVPINDGNNTVEATIVGPVVDQTSGMPVEGQIVVQYSSGQRAIFTKEQLQAFADAANLERLNGFEQNRAAVRTEAKRPKFDQNDEFTLLDDNGRPIRGSIVNGLDEDGNIEISTEDRFNGLRVQRISPAELEKRLVDYNGEPVPNTVVVPENAATVPNPKEIATEPPVPSSGEAPTSVTALSRVPVDEHGKPNFEAVDSDTAWDAIVEKTANEKVAQSFADNMVANAEAALKSAEKAKTKASTDIDEFMEAENERLATIERAKATLDHWKAIAGTTQRRESERRASEDAEARRRAQERAEEEARLKAEREEAERREREEAEIKAAAEAADRKRLAQIDKRYKEVYDEVKAYPSAIERLGQQEPETIEEVASLVLSSHKLLWGDKSGGTGMQIRMGVRGETGFGEGERRKLFGMFASAENGGQSIQRLAEDAMQEMCGIYSVPYDNSRARDALIDVLMSAQTRSDITNYIRNQRLDQAMNLMQQEQRWEREEADRWAWEGYGMSYEDFEVMAEMYEEKAKECLENLDEAEYFNNIADETKKQKENESGRKKRSSGENESSDRAGDGPRQAVVAEGEVGGRSGGAEILHGAQPSYANGGIAPVAGEILRSDAGPENADSPGNVAGAASGRRISSGEAVTESTARGIGPTSDSRGARNLGIGRNGETSAQEKRLTKEEASAIIAEMEEKAIVAPEMELTIENWDAQFGEDGIVSTPIGNVKMGENQFTKLMRQGRNGKLGMIKPTLENPDIIIEDASEAKDADVTERESSYVFVKAFVKPDGSRYYYFTSVTVRKDGHEVVVSNQEKRRSVLTNLLIKGKLVWKHADNVSPASDVADGLYSPQGKMSDPASEGTVAPQTNISENKVSTLSLEKQEDKEKSSLGERLKAAEAEVNTDPTPGQKEAGNYKKGHVQVGMFDVTIEQPVGSVRRGKDADGKEWKTTMQNTYGYIRGTEGVDGDHIDVFLSTDIDAWNGRRVVIVDQYNPDGSFDEHKVMLGFNEKADAINAYLANYEKGWEKGRRLVFSTATLEDFEKWIESSHRKQKPYHEYKIADKAEVDESTPENPVSATDYTIDTYTTKKNKTYHRVVFPRADKEVWQERLNLAKKMGGTSVPKGYGFKSREEAAAFAKAVADPTAVADAQPLSLEDIRGSIIEEPTTTSSTEAEQSSETETQPEVDKPVNPSGNKLVTDERYAELRERMRKKLGGQLNMGVDPEILAIGTEMAVYHIEKGARKFKAYAYAMIADLGDAIRPYLKAFYNAVRDMPEAEAAGLVADMDSYDEVRNVDIANFDKPSSDAMATAAAVVAEQEAEKEKEEAERKLKEKRKKHTNPDGSTTETVVESGTEIEITSGDFIPGVRPIVDAQKPSGKKKPGKEKPKSTTDGGLFDTVEDDTTTAPAITVPEQRPTADLMGDSAAFQEREAQTVELVEEIGGVIESRVAMLQLDAESVKPLTMTDVKKMASKYPALKDISDTDLQELVELAMTQLTRSEALVNIDGTAEAQRAAYDHIVNLYQIQPSLNARDSERLIKQQYSTPTPFGYVMGQFVRAGGKTVGSMLEPSAGNGALTITVHPSVIHVNDIDDARLANLRKLGYDQVTAQDALLPFAGDKVDVVMTNPPFGTVTEKVYDGVFRISSLEGQMAINALEQMKDDGRAAIVIGGNTSYRTNGSMNPKDAAFFGYLYSHYNVADVINISGKALYSRNGTGYDVRMILIDGRKTGEFQRVYPPVKAKARAEQVTTFDELYKRVQDDIQQIQQVGSQSADVQREPETTTDGTSSAPIRSGNNRPNSGAGQRPGTTSDAVRDTPRTDSGQPATVDDASRPVGVDNAVSGDAGSSDNVPQPKPQQPRSVGSGSAQNGTGRSGSDGRGAATSRPDSGTERLAVKPDLTAEKVPYPNQSGNGFTLMSVVPAAQAQVLQKSLGEIGDVDQYLVDELGYSSKEELYGYLAAEQIDSVALAIHQMNKGNAFIIGDMTGVGKGRQGAALIRYVVKQGKVPIYFTQKPTLFTDNYRDLADIGSSDLRPFIIASNPKDANIVDADGNIVHKLPSKKEQERVFAYIIEHGTLPDEYDYVLTTYDQIKNGTADYTQNEDGTWNIEARKLPKKSKGYTTADYNGQIRRDALAKLAEGNIAILDESHTVGGDSGCGRYMQMLTSSAGGVTFLSATFAKRADNMPIYAQRTAIAETGVKVSELIEAIMKGGVTLQEIMSKQLVESGQMIRRERSFEGVTIDWLSVEEEADRRQRAQFDEVAAIFNAIRNFQDDYITPIINAKNEAAAEHGATVGHTQGTKDLGVKNVPFASKMYNLVNQLLFALKVDAVADRVVENLRNGYKPVISFTNTMEGFLASAPKGVAMDEVPNFSLTLMRALEGVMRFTEKDADENTEGSYISLSELSAEGQKAYNAIREKIMSLSADLPISPMDAIRMKIEAAGYSVAEITGRTLQLSRTEDGRYIVESRKDRDKKAAMRDFNSGKLDVLMINKSGSTGISLHASSKFEDQRPRVMVFAQFQSDINDEVQMRGRIDRSGQVTRGRYEYIMSTIPAEQRIQMMFKAKLKSLDANTTSSQKSKFNEMEIVDYLNKYGDEVVWEYMKEHPELEERLGDPLDMLQEKDSEDGPRTSEKEDTSKKTGCAGKISRYLAFLSVDEQDEIFKEITEAYRVKIQLLDDAGENDLEITTMPLRAETKRKQIWHEGVNPGSGNAFADNTYVEEVEVDVLKKPMKREEIAEYIRKLAGDLYSERDGVIDWEHYAYNKGEEIHQFYQSKADEVFGKMKEAGEARIAKAREKAVAAATKARGRGENNFADAEIQSLADTVANEEREKEEQKQKKRHNEIMGVNNRIQTLLTRLHAGSIYVVPQDLKQGTAGMFSQTFGTFVGFKFNKSYTLGSSTAIFATLDGRRKVELALSDPAIAVIISATQIAQRYSPKEYQAITMENWDGKVPTQTREKRYIITGNLLQALVDTEKGERTRGNLISYSTIDGETRQGILMGENFKPTDLRNSASLSSRLVQIREGKAVVSENGDVQISKEIYDMRHRGEYELRVPKSKQRGGIYTMHPDLLKLVEGHNFITKGNNMVAYVTEDNIANVVDMLSRAPFNLTVLQESQLTDTEILERHGDGYGAYSDEEISYINDPISKVMGKNRFSKKRQAEFAARERQRMVNRIGELADKLHLDNVEILTDASQLEGKRAKAKGFYNKRTRKITIVIPNNVSTIDAEQTLLHEAVAHYGLRQLFGEHFDTFLDNVYQSADESIRRKIAEMAAKNGWDFRTATEEYLAGLAENTNFNEAQNYGGWWSQIKRLFLDMLEKIGFEGFRDKVGVVLTDNELRYILWRSYENLAEPGRYRSILGEAADVAKQSELKVGNYAEHGIEVEYAAEPSDMSSVNEKFNEQLNKLSEDNADKIALSLGRPSSILLSAGVEDRPLKLYGNKIIKKMKKHGFALSELRDLPDAVAHPIAVFNNLGREGNRSILTELHTKQGNILVTIDLGVDQDVDFNIVSSVFGKRSENVIAWILKGMLVAVDKEKALNFLSYQSAPIAATAAKQELISAAKVVKSFENPTIEDEELFRPGDFTEEAGERSAKETAREEYDRRVRVKTVDKSRLKTKSVNFAGQLHEAYLDSMRALGILQEAVSRESGMDVQDFEDAYTEENHMSSRNQTAEEAYKRDFFEPMCKAVAEVCKGKKGTYRELLDYIIAKHGLERNAYMRSKAVTDGIDQAEADATDYSGLTALTKESNVADAEAAAGRLVKEYEEAHDTAELWRRINAATRETLRTRYQGGLLNKEVYEKILGQYQYYIPLKGWSETTAVDVYEYAAGGYGLGSALMTAYGRNSLADDPLATIMIDAQRTIMEANRNIMKQKLLNLALNHHTDLLTVSKQWFVEQADGTWLPDNPTIPEDADADIVDAIVKRHEADMLALEAQGKAVTVRKGLKLGLIDKSADTAQHVVKVKRNGETFCIYVNGDPRAARAINGMLNPDSGAKSRGIKYAQSVKAFMSKAFTTWNPEFVVRNLSRDVMFAGVAVAVKEDGKYVRNYTGNITSILAKASLPRLLYKWEHGTLDETNETERYFKEFLMNGGETGFTQLNTVEKAKRDMQRFLREAQGGMSSLPKKAWRGFWSGVEFMNRSAEDTTRFAVYMTSRQQGRSVLRSIHDAKEITVNFNKKGSGAWGARYLNFAYVFFNAAMQSIANAGRLVYRNPGKASAAMGIFISAGLFMPMVSQILAGLCGGDGDDYWNQSEWVRRNNIMLYIPFTKEYFAIPISHELRPFYGMGEIAYSIICGKENIEDGIWKAAEGFTGLLPVDITGNGGDAVVSLAPTILQPVVQIWENVDYFGNPIYKKTPWNADDPEWTKAYKGTNGFLVDLTKMLSEAGSTKDEYDVIHYPKHWFTGDINPAWIEHLIESYTGGFGKTIIGAGKTVSMLWNEDARELRNVPIVRKFLLSSDGRAVERRFSNEYFKLRDEYEESKKYLRKLNDLDDDGAFGVADRVSRWLDTEKGTRYYLLDRYFKDLRALQLKMNEETDTEAINLYQQDMDSVKRELVNALHDPDDYMKRDQK